MEAIDRVIKLTTIDTLRSFDCHVYDFDPTTDHVNIIRRTLLSYYEDTVGYMVKNMLVAPSSTRLPIGAMITIATTKRRTFNAT